MASTELIDFVTEPHRGVGLPDLDEPERTIAVLHRATGTNVVYLGSERYLWGYLAAIHEAFRAVAEKISVLACGRLPWRGRRRRARKAGTRRSFLAWCPLRACH